MTRIDFGLWNCMAANAARALGERKCYGHNLNAGMNTAVERVRF